MNDRLLLDVRHAVRVLFARPGVLVAAVVSLTLALLTTVLFYSVIDVLFWRYPPHVGEPRQVRLLYFGQTGSERLSPRTSFPAFELLRDRLKGAGVAAFAQHPVTIGDPDGGSAREFVVELVTPNYFPTIGVSPAMGRFLSPDEREHASLFGAVVSHRFWRSVMSGAPDVLDKTIRVGNRDYPIIGVAPPRFGGATHGTADVWLHIDAASTLVDPAALTSPTRYWVSVLARFPDASVENCANEASVILRAEEAFAAKGREVRVHCSSILPGEAPERLSQARLWRWVAIGSALILVISCASVATLLLVQFIRRSGELAIRASLGAPTWQLVRQVILSVAMLMAAAFVSTALSLYWVAAAASSLLLPELGAALFSGWRTLAQLAALSAVAAALCALPAGAFVAGRRWSITLASQGGGRSSFQRATSSALIALQCALCVVLLAGASLFGGSLQNVTALDLGIDTSRVVYASAQLPPGISRAEALAAFEQLAQRVAALPGVQGATVAAGLPLRDVWAAAVGLPEDVWLGANQIILGHSVGPDYFEITGLRVTRGRPLQPADQVPGTRVAVINESFARAFWSSSDPIGSCLRMGNDAECTRIVGVAADTPRANIIADREHEVYVPLRRPGQFGSVRQLALAIRVAAEGPATLDRIRGALVEAGANTTNPIVTPVSALLAPQLRSWALGALLFSSFGIVAVVMACVALYGLLSFMVSWERHSIAIMLALGASPRSIERAIVSRGARICCIGSMIGVAVAMFLAPRAESFAFGLSVFEPSVFIVPAIAVPSVGLLFSYLPARRAARLEISTLLRSA